MYSLFSGNSTVINGTVKIFVVPSLWPSLINTGKLSGRLYSFFNPINPFIKACNFTGFGSLFVIINYFKSILNI